MNTRWRHGRDIPAMNQSTVAGNVYESLEVAFSMLTSRLAVDLTDLGGPRNVDILLNSSHWRQEYVLPVYLGALIRGQITVQ